MRKKSKALWPFAAIAGLLLVSLSGCSNEDQAYSKAQQQLESAALPAERGSSAPQAEGESLFGELTVTGLLYNKDSAIVQLAQEFMAIHPQVTIDFQHEMDLEEMVNLSQDEIDRRGDSYDQKLRTQLLSGRLADIVFGASGRINLYGLAESGLFHDLKAYWESDTAMKQEEYFTGVLDTFSTADGMPFLPFSFQTDVVYLNKAVIDGLGLELEPGTAVNYQELLEWRQLAGERGLLSAEAPLCFGDYGKSVFFSTERSCFLNPEAKTASFASPKFMDFLTRTNEIILGNADLRMSFYDEPVLTDELLRCRESGADTTVSSDYSGAYQYVTQGEAAFVEMEALSPLTLLDLEEPYPYLAGPFLLESTDGRLPILSADEFAVPESSPNKALAWEFIKYCVSKRETALFENGMAYASSIPICKANLKLLTESQAEVWGPTYEAYGKEKRLATSIDGDQMVQQIEELLDRPLLNSKMYSIPDCEEILTEYYDRGLTTAEQCADKIQDRAEIWLGES